MVRAFLSQVGDRQGQIAPIAQNDLDYLSANGYVVTATQDEYGKGVEEVDNLSQTVDKLRAEKDEEERAKVLLQSDEQKEHSFTFHFEGKEQKEELEKRIQDETATVSKEKLEIDDLESKVNSLIQEKSTMDRMVAYGGGYVSVTDLGTVILSDLTVRDYRVSGDEFPDFLSEIQATYAELRTIADKATWYTNLIKPMIPGIKEIEHPLIEDPDETVEIMHQVHEAQSMIWNTAIGLGKLQGDPNQLGAKFTQAFGLLRAFDSTIPSKLMAAEIMTAAGSQDVQNLESILKGLDQTLRKQNVPKEVSAGVATTMLAGRRYDGTFPVDRFAQFRQLTSSYDAAAILAVMNVPYDQLSSKFEGFRSLFTTWGYTKSEDTEIASAYLAIGELDLNEVTDKLRYIEDQLKNYLGYPLVAASILASIPVFEAHEALDLMEKGVTLLSGYASGLERSELVALAVRMIHGVRNDLVRQIDSTAKITPTPVQFTFTPHPGLFIWYHPVIIAHSTYHAAFSGVGGFHPAHSHGVGVGGGGFAG